MLVMWLHTFVASDGWGAGVCVWVWVCVWLGYPKGFAISSRYGRCWKRGLAYFGCDCEVECVDQPQNLYMKKKLTRVHIFTFSLHPVPGCEKLVYTRIILLLLYFVSFAMHISHYWDNGQRNKQHIDCRCVSRQGLAGSSAHPLARCADLIGSLRSRIDISPTTTVVLG
jgi:hypothetical protein